MSNTLLSDEERRAAFAGTAPKVPRKTVLSILVACLLLGLGGVVVDHFFGGPSKVGTTPVATETKPAPLGRGAVSGGPPGVPAQLSSLMGLQSQKAAPAPPLVLQGASGATVSLASYRGKVVVVSFLDASCDDVCSVLGREFREARADLAADGVPAGAVELITVNTDPLATAPGDAAPVDRALQGVAGWQFLTASLKRLDAVWSAYGITVEVDPTSRLVSHTNALDFLNPAGEIVASATPFANEVKAGSYELAPATVRLYARGIADEIRQIEKGAAR